MIKERVVRGFMVCAERTRKGKVVIKTRENWDSESVTQFDTAELPENIDHMAANQYFWDSLRYGVYLALLEQLEGGDAVTDDFDFSGLRVIQEPVPGIPSLDYFGLIEEAIPSLKLQRVPNGF